MTQNILKKSAKQTHIISVGGDGTLHEVINGAARFSNALISCIPAGSGNDFARGIQKTSYVSDALSLLVTHKEGAQAVDIGEFMTANRSGYFINSLGMGMDAEITYEVNQSQWKRWFNLFKAGQLIYMYTILKRLFTYKRSDMDVILDNQAHHFKKSMVYCCCESTLFWGRN